MEESNPIVKCRSVQNLHVMRLEIDAIIFLLSFMLFCSTPEIRPLGHTII